MPVAITNITELRAEILQLKLKKSSQERELKQHFNSPKAIWNTATVLFRRSKHSDTTAAPLDIWNRISKALLPLTMDKTLFRKSNFMVKAVVRMITRNAAKHIDKRSVTGWWQKLKGILPGNDAEKTAISAKRDIRAKRLY